MFCSYSSERNSLQFENGNFKGTGKWNYLPRCSIPKSGEVTFINAIPEQDYRLKFMTI